MPKVYPGTEEIPEVTNFGTVQASNMIQVTSKSVDHVFAPLKSSMKLSGINQSITQSFSASLKYQNASKPHHKKGAISDSASGLKVPFPFAL